MNTVKKIYSGVDCYFSRKKIVHIIIFTLFSLTLACNFLIPSQPTAVDEVSPTELILEETPTPALMGILAHAIRLSPSEVTYSIILVNLTDTQVEGVTLQADIPAGAGLVEVLTDPLDAEIGQNTSSVSWTLESVPSLAILGPFAYRINIPDNPSTVEVVASWGKNTGAQISTKIDQVEDASTSQVATQMSAIQLADIPNAAIVYGYLYGLNFNIPLGESTETPATESPLIDLPGTGIRYFIPAGDRGEVSISRLDTIVVPENLIVGQTIIASFDITKANTGSAIFVVPLAQPAPPFSVVRVFADSGLGFTEQSLMGMVSFDGLHASFAADSASTYGLAIDATTHNSGFMRFDRNIDPYLFDAIIGSVSSSIGDLGGLIENLGPTQYYGVTSAVAPEGAEHPMDYLADSQWIAGLFIISISAYDADFDGDGVTNEVEMGMGTSMWNADSDNDGVSDGLELINGTDATDGSDYPGHRSQERVDEDDDTSEEESEESTSGIVDVDCPYFVCFSLAERSSQGSGNPTVHTTEWHEQPEPPSDYTGPSPDNLPGGGTYGDFNIGDYLPTSIHDCINLGIESVQGTFDADGAGGGFDPYAVEGPESAASDMDIRSLRGIVGVEGDSIVLLIPGGQDIMMIPGPPPQLAESVKELEAPELASPPPTQSPTATPTLGITAVPPTATFTAPPPKDTSGPKVSGANASPNPALTTTPVTISAKVDDPSGVASVILYVKVGKGGYTTAGKMKLKGGSSYSFPLGTLTPAGTYSFRIVATDNLGNANCSTGNLDACPGGSFVVNIP